MIEQLLYISTSVEQASHLTGLAVDEIETLVGRFAKHSHRAGKLRGKVVVYIDGSVEIRKCFGNKLIWRKDD